MNKNIKIFIVLIVLALALSACAPASTPAEEAPAEEAPAEEAASVEEAAPVETITIGISMHNQINEFTKNLADAMVAACEEQGWDTMMTDANGDASTQITQIETLMSSDVDGILIVPVDSDAMAASVDKINEAGIPVVVANMIVNTENFDAYVGSNDVSVGEDITNWVADMLGGSGNVVVMEGAYGYAAQAQRTEGIEKGLADNTGIQLLAMDTANWSRDEAMTLMENWLNEYGDQIDAIIAENDEMGLGAMRAIVAQNLDKKIYVVGVDGISDALTAISEGTYDCSYLQDARGQGEGAVDVMAKILAGEQYDKELWIPFQAVTVDNVADFLE